MTTELERRLREALHEDAQRARLVNQDGPPALEARPLSDRRPPRRPAVKLVAVAAAIVLIVAAGVAVVQNREQEPDVSTVDPLTRVFTDLSLGDAEVFTDVPPGSTVELPPAPISERDTPHVVWSGTEMIVWGGMDADQATLDDGAAFDLAAGTWRVIARAPIEPRLYATVAWTGTEMVVWGGQTGFTNGTGLTDGAAYNPTTDTWRRLPDGPFDSWEFAGPGTWTGEDLIVVGVEATPVGESYPMAAYNPASDEWRRLADAPPGFDFDLVGTSETIVTTATIMDRTTGEAVRTDVLRYDRSTDAWELVDEVASEDVSLLPVTDGDGVARAAVVLAHETGAEMVVIDGSGTKVGTLPGLPADPATFGQRSASGGVWVGEEALFWIRPLEAATPLEHWALNLARTTWRSLDADAAPPSFGVTLAADAGVLIGWAPLPPDQDGPSTGVVYRPPTPAGE